MTHLVRHLNTHLYLHDGGWTPDPAQADHFTHSIDAIKTCLAHHYGDVELILQLYAQPNPRFDLHLHLFDHPPLERCLEQADSPQGMPPILPAAALEAEQHRGGTLATP